MPPSASLEGATGVAAARSPRHPDARRTEMPMGMVALTVVALATLVGAASFVMLVQNLGRFPGAPEGRRIHTEHLPPVAVIVVAGDDVDGLDAAVSALLAQGPPVVEVVVAASGSAAGTLRLSASPDARLRFMEPETPPAGWVRRSYALYQAARSSSHPYLLFVDDAVLVRPDGIRRLTAAATWKRADTLAVLPEMTARTGAEQLLVPFLTWLAMLVQPPAAINDPEQAAVPGQLPLLLVRRSLYGKVGGHQGFRGAELDDRALAARLKSQGSGFAYIRGKDVAVLQTDESLGRIWRGWRRQLNALAEGRPGRAAGIAAALVVIFALPWPLLAVAPLMVALAPEAASSPWTGVLLLGGANVLLTFATRRLLRDALGIDDSRAWGQPAAAVLTAAMICAATLDVEMGPGAAWRRYLPELGGSWGRRG